MLRDQLLARAGWLVLFCLLTLTCGRTYAGGTVTVEIIACPSTVQLDQLVDVTLRFKFTGDDNDGPWQVTSIALRDDDIWPVYNTIRSVENPFKINTQGQWYSNTFTGVKLSDFGDGGDGVELYGWVEIDDNDWTLDPDGSSAVKQVTVEYPKPDLVVTAVWTDPPSPVEGRSFVVKATVKNQGNAEANPGGMDQFLNVGFYLGATELGQETDWCTSIARGASLTFTSSSETAPTPKTYSLRAVADSQKDVAESDETNNEKTVTVTVLPCPKILSAYWWAPLDVPQGAQATMCAEVQNMAVGSTCTFKIYEDDIIGDDLVATVSGQVYAADGKSYVQAKWTTAWQSDYLTDPEFYFEVSYGNVNLSSSTDSDDELRVRERMQPTTEKGDFEYYPGIATSKATPLGSRIPIVLLHGSGSDQRTKTMNYWLWWLQRFNEPDLQSKYKVYRFVYTSSLHIDANSADFARFVNEWSEFQGRSIVILAHSMGGLVARHALNSNAELREKTLRLITLGTPHFGSPGASPTWVYASLPTVGLGELVTAIERFSFTGTPGEFDLAWYNPSELPTLAANAIVMFHAHTLYDEALLDNSLKNPFCGTAIMASTIADARITALGGSFQGLLDGLGNESGDEVNDEVGMDHAKLLVARVAMSAMQKRDGSFITHNDGLVPVESALLGNIHPQVRKINLTDAYDLEIDHSAFLDIRNVIDTVVDRLEELTHAPSISGRVTFNGSGLSDVVLNGLPGTQITDTNGAFVATVPIGWGGTLTPVKIGYTFAPPSRAYSSVTAALLNQDFTASSVPVPPHQVADVAANFQEHTPNAGWQYLKSSAPTGQATALTWGAVGNADNQGYGGGETSGNLPAIVGSSVPGKPYKIYLDGQYNTGMPGTDLLLHPGVPGGGGNYVIMRYTFNAADVQQLGPLARIQGSFRELIPGGDSIDAYVFKNTTQLFKTNGADGKLQQIDSSFRIETTVAGGDTISFVAGSGAYIDADETALRATISLWPAEVDFATAYRAAVRAEPSLISLYPFNDGTAKDAIGTNDGVLVGTCTWGPGLGGAPNQTLDLDGGHVSLGTVSAFNFTSQAGTVELLVRTDWPLDNPPGYNPTMFADRDGHLVNYSLHLRNSKNMVDFWNGQKVSTMEIPVAGTDWHHLAVVFGAGSWTLYWDGQCKGTQPLALGTLPEVPTQLGSSSPAGNEVWLGELDEVAFYSTALTEQTIRDHYAALIPPTPELAWQTSGNMLTISWTGTTFKLQSSARLADPAGWTDVAGGTTSPVTVNTSRTGQEFFRLVNK